jgi:hypothetical protein
MEQKMRRMSGALTGIFVKYAKRRSGAMPNAAFSEVDYNG